MIQSCTWYIIFDSLLQFNVNNACCKSETIAPVEEKHIPDDCGILIIFRREIYASYSFLQLLCWLYLILCSLRIANDNYHN